MQYYLDIYFDDGVLITVRPARAVLIAYRRKMVAGSPVLPGATYEQYAHLIKYYRSKQ